MREVEAQAFGAHRGAGLVDVLAERVAQRALQQVGARVVGHRRAAARGIDARVHGVAGAQLAVERARAAPGRRRGGRPPRPARARRAPRSRRRRRPGRRPRGRTASARSLTSASPSARGSTASTSSRRRARRSRRTRVRGGRAREARDALVVDAVAAPRGRAGALALLLHVPLEALEVDAEPGLAGELGGQLDREAVGVVQLEDVAGVRGSTSPCVAAPARSGRRAGASRSASVCAKRSSSASSRRRTSSRCCDELGVAVGQRLDHDLVQARRGTASRGRSASRAARRGG